MEYELYLVAYTLGSDIVSFRSMVERNYQEPDSPDDPGNEFLARVSHHVEKFHARIRAGAGCLRPSSEAAIDEFLSVSDQQYAHVNAVWAGERRRGLVERLAREEKADFPDPRANYWANEAGEVAPAAWQEFEAAADRMMRALPAPVCAMYRLGRAVARVLNSTFEDYDPEDGWWRTKSPTHVLGEFAQTVRACLAEVGRHTAGFLSVPDFVYWAGDPVENVLVLDQSIRATLGRPPRTPPPPRTLPGKARRGPMKVPQSPRRLPLGIRPRCGS